MTTIHSATDVTKVNPFSLIYVKGNEFTDGSKRMKVDADGKFIQVEARTLGAWQHSEFGLGTSSLFLGPDLRLSTAGNHFMTEREDGEHKHLYPHMHIDELQGTNGQLTTPVLSQKIFNFPIEPDDSGEFIGTIFNEAVFISPVSAMGAKSYLKTGSVAATLPVRLQIWEGIDDTGILIWDFNYPASTFGPINTTIGIDVPGFLELKAGTSYFTRYDSEAPFSLRANVAVDTAWNEADLYLVSHVEVLQDNMTISREADLTLDREANFVVNNYF